MFLQLEIIGTGCLQVPYQLQYRYDIVQYGKGTKSRLEIKYFVFVLLYELV
jgi:hypothetical protein